jgi:hypothetical protein
MYNFGRLFVVSWDGITIFTSDSSFKFLKRYQKIMNRTVTITLAMLVLAAAAGASEADQPPVPPVSKAAAPAASGREPENQALQASPAPESNPAGVMVFIDPATGKIVQPTEAEIGRLARSPREGPNAKAPVITIQGPGGAVGIVLTPESFSYSVATRMPGGKIALDCVTGDRAAQRIVDGESGNSKAPPQAKVPPDETKK